MRYQMTITRMPYEFKRAVNGQSEHFNREKQNLEESKKI